MRIIAFFLSILSLNATEPLKDFSLSSEQESIHNKLSPSYTVPDNPTNNYTCYPHFDDNASILGFSLAPSAPPMEEDSFVQHHPTQESSDTWHPEGTPYLDLRPSDKQIELLTSPSSKQLYVKTSREEELFKLKQENKTLSEKIDLMANLMQENNQMLKTIIAALQDQGINLEGLQNGQIQIENDLLSMAGKLKKWQTDIMQSQEHFIVKFLRWFKVGFSVTTSVGTALTTYYTIAWCTSILPMFLTPPGWVLISSSAVTGALYYIAYT